jgi:putative membrane-bound dehydrogenase-like protein
MNMAARKITVFADGLDIPKGLYPYKNGVIAWSVPYIWFLEDTDGDDKADKRTILYGPFGWERDAHGDQSSFRRGFDGWMYATHGYNNISHVTAADGSELDVASGNTYRIRLDRSHIEQYTHGQVNPFGLCFDNFGSIYSADCHSAPIYELLRDGWYPSFGKPDDGLGFAPTMIDHSHGSTAIAGIVYYIDDLWPDEYQNNMFIGNVMTSRLNHDKLVPRGSSKTAIEKPDFMTTTDPWFRPVDSQLGPDGSLYVADFYNRIIGHYEVPLNHPGRDRHRARIWRITYKDKRRDLPNLAAKSPEQLVGEFRSPNLPRRLLALNEFVDRVGTEGAPLLKQTLSKSDATPSQIVQSLWGLERLNALDDSFLEQFAKNNDPVIRTHVMHILSERKLDHPAKPPLLLQGLRDSNPLVQRAAADAISQFPNAPTYVRPLLDTLSKVPGYDDHLRYTLRMALRNQLREPAGATLLSADEKYDEQDSKEIASVCVAIPSAPAASFLLTHLTKVKEPEETVANYVRHAVRYLNERDVPKMTAFIRENYQGDVDQQLSFFKALQEGSAQRGLKLSDETKSWGEELAAGLLDSAGKKNLTWQDFPISGKKANNPWFLQKRSSADGDKSSTFLCSLPPGGESLTGILRSQPFTAPARLTFWMAGHDGYPDKPAQGNNLIRLVSLKDHSVLARAAAPRNDIAQKVEWDLGKAEGRQVYLEIIDADTGGAYAWLAAGRFEPDVAPMPSISPSQTSKRIQSAADLAKTLRLNALASRMGRLLATQSVDLSSQGSLAEALVSLHPNEVRAAMVPLVLDSGLPGDLRKRIGRALAQGDAVDATPTLVVAMHSIPTRLQVKVAQSLAGSVKGAETLLTLAEKSQASPTILLDKTVQDKIASLNSASVKERFGKATQNLEPVSETIQKLIEERRAAYNPAQVNPAEGAKVFTQNCAVCHQIEGVGAVIGPQLDGIGSRGLERLIEDVLDPNRNVDINFRAQILVLNDDDVVSGLVRREEGELLVLADSTGKETSIPKKNIKSRRSSETSLMPANFGDIIPEADFENLISYLLSKGVPVKH